MHRLVTAVAFLYLLPLSAFGANFTGEVVRVMDGDTLAIMQYGFAIALLLADGSPIAF